MNPMKYCLKEIKRLRRSATEEHEFSAFYKDIKSKYEEYMCSLLDFVRLCYFISQRKRSISLRLIRLFVGLLVGWVVWSVPVWSTWASSEDKRTDRNLYWWRQIEKMATSKLLWNSGKGKSGKSCKICYASAITGLQINTWDLWTIFLYKHIFFSVGIIIHAVSVFANATK